MAKALTKKFEQLNLKVVENESYETLQENILTALTTLATAKSQQYLCNEILEQLDNIDGQTDLEKELITEINDRIFLARGLAQYKQTKEYINNETKNYYNTTFGKLADTQKQFMFEKLFKFFDGYNLEMKGLTLKWATAH